MKYRHPELLDRESLFRLFFWMKHTPPVEVLSCLAPKGVRRLLGGRVLPVFANT